MVDADGKPVDEGEAEEQKGSSLTETKEENKEEHKEEHKEDTQIGGDVMTDDIEKLNAQFLELYKALDKPGAGQSYEDTVISAEEFEKDNDSNFHIDFMAAMGNSRAASYKLEPMSWLQVKLKAGRIVPAMATTTASIAGLQTLELVKILRKVKKEDHRNIFLNFAVPIMQASEPLHAPKIKLTDTIETTLWDRWEVDAQKLSL